MFIKGGNNMLIPYVPDDCWIDDEEIYGVIIGKEYSRSSDLSSTKRHIIVYDDVDREQAEFIGEYDIKCTIINTVTVNGIHNYDTRHNCDAVLIKTIYHGRLHAPLSVVEKNKGNINHNLIEYGTFTISAAFSAANCIWINNGVITNHAVLDLTILSFIDLKYKLNSGPLHLSNIDNVAYTYTLTDDNGIQEEILPIPSPMFYTSAHAVMNGHQGMKIDLEPIRGCDLVDKDTELITVQSKKEDVPDSDMSAVANITKFFDEDGRSMSNICDDQDSFLHNTYSDSLMISYQSLFDRTDQLIFRLYILYNTYLCNSLQFSYDNVSKKISNLKASYSFTDTSVDWFEKFKGDFLEDSTILTYLGAITEDLEFGDIGIFINMTDVRIDIGVTKLNFKKGSTYESLVKKIHITVPMHDQLLNSFYSFTTRMKPLSSLSIFGDPSNDHIPYSAMWNGDFTW